MNNSEQKDIDPAVLKIMNAGPVVNDGNLFLLRLVAHIIDSVISIVIFALPVTVFVIIIMLELIPLSEAQAGVLGQLVGFPAGLLVALYYGYFNSQKGGTIGKLFMGLRVVNNHDGSNLSFLKGMGRDIIGKIISSSVLMIGYLLPLFRQDQQALHDLVFSTKVIRMRA